jgi:hypothetical protein
VPHLSDDETVAKMGHPRVVELLFALIRGLEVFVGGFGLGLVAVGG